MAPRRVVAVYKRQVQRGRFGAVFHADRLLLVRIQREIVVAVVDAVVARHQVRERRVDVGRHRDKQVVSVLLDRFDLRVALREHIVAVVGAQAVRRVEALGACKVEAVLQVVADRKVKLLPRMRRGLDRLRAEAVRLSVEGHVAAGDFRRDRLGRLVDHRDARAALGLADDQRCV